jgi:hypothetical protein
MGSVKFVPDTWKVFEMEVPTLVSKSRDVGLASMVVLLKGVLKAIS